MYSLTSCRYHPVPGGWFCFFLLSSSSWCLSLCGGKTFYTSSDARVWLLNSVRFKLCNLLHLSAAAARRELLLFLRAMMVVLLLLVHVLHRRRRPSGSQPREKSFKFPPCTSQGIRFGCFYVTDSMCNRRRRRVYHPRNPLGGNRRITRSWLCWCAGPHSPNLSRERENECSRGILCWRLWPRHDESVLWRTALVLGCLREYSPSRRLVSVYPNIDDSITMNLYF